MAKRAKHRYTGVLAKGIKSPFRERSYAERLLDIANGYEREAAKSIDAERLMKLPDLFAHFRMKFPPFKREWTDWHELVWRMAVAHVPGFQVEAKRGAPKKIGLDWELYARVRLREIEKGLTSVAACKALARKMKPSGGRVPSAATLRRRYTAAKPSAARTFAKAAAHVGKSETEFLREFLAASDCEHKHP